MEQFGLLSQVHPAVASVVLLAAALGTVHHVHILIDMATVLVKHFRAAFSGCHAAARRLWRALTGRDDGE